MTGVGEVKLDKFGQAFLDGLQAHEAEHGRPENLPEIPAGRAEKREKKKEKAKEFSSTAQESLKLFLELGDVDAVAEKRGLKPRTIWNHLAQAANFGKLDYRTLVNITDEEILLIQKTFDDFRQKGIDALTPVFEKLEEKYSFDIIRLVRDCAE
jgi:ATP-dependent DNA helicase RecQ